MIPLQIYYLLFTKKRIVLSVYAELNLCVSLQRRFYGDCQLVGTGSAPSGAVVAPQHRCDSLCISAFHQFPDGQQISRAAACKFYIVQFTRFV
jgi:hypothetical protein